MRPVQTKRSEGGCLIRDFEFNNKYYFHRIYTDDDSVVLFEFGEKKPILVFDNHMNVCSFDSNGTSVQIGRFSIRDDYWHYEHSGDPEILEHMKSYVMDNCINGMLVQLEHTSGVESNIDSELFVSKMYLSYLAGNSEKGIT